jgi:hypothetical protein
MKAIKGNIWAIPAFIAAVVFSPQLHLSKWNARGMLLRRMACSFDGHAFTNSLPGIMFATAISLVT